MNDSAGVVQRNHPYKSRPRRAFWRQTVEQAYPLDIGSWYRKKFAIDGVQVATAGSCFAQHIGRKLRASRFNYLDVEPAPPQLSEKSRARFGYGMYSARYGNVYTTRQLLQLLQRATGEFVPLDRSWRQGPGFVDPFRPTIEPEPMRSVDEVEVARDQHLAAVRSLFEQTDVFIFTLGLTEAWVSAEDGAAFPVAPGVSGGEFDATRHRFVNLAYPDVLADLTAFMSRARQIRNDMKFILTVSPVPLMATASEEQVVVASSYSKSVLRAVAGHLAEQHAYVDYFPSYEIISSHVMRGQFYHADMRSVAQQGVEHVMRQFFLEHAPPAAPARTGPVRRKAGMPARHADDDVACDEELLAAFGPGG